jgi:hypothetical protein
MWFDVAHHPAPMKPKRARLLIQLPSIRLMWPPADGSTRWCAMAAANDHRQIDYSMGDHSLAQEQIKGRAEEAIGKAKEAKGKLETEAGKVKSKGEQAAEALPEEAKKATG